MSKRARKHNAAGRSTGEPRFIQIPYWVLESDAFLSLTPGAQITLAMMLKRFNGTNNGSIQFGARSGCLRRKTGVPEYEEVSFGIGKSAQAENLAELEAAGFIRCTKESVFERSTNYDSGQRLVREWCITWLADKSGLPSKEFATLKGIENGKFRAKRPTPKNRLSVRSTGQEATIQSVRPDNVDAQNAQKGPYSPVNRTKANVHSPVDRTHLDTIPSVLEDIAAQVKAAAS